MHSWLPTKQQQYRWKNRQKFSIILGCASYPKTSCQEKNLNHQPEETQEFIKFGADKLSAL